MVAFKMGMGKSFPPWKSFFSPLDYGLSTLFFSLSLSYWLQPHEYRFFTQIWNFSCFTKAFSGVM